MTNTIAVDEINELVFILKREDEESIIYNNAYSELVSTIMTNTIIPKVRSKSYHLRGDIAEGESMALELLVDKVETWSGEGRFLPLYKKALENRLYTLSKYLSRDLRKHNTSYEVSLDYTGSHGNSGGVVLEYLDDESLLAKTETDNSGVSLEKLMAKYAEENPQNAKLIETMCLFGHDTPKPEKTDAFCRHYGVTEYTPIIQKRVSRVRESFRKFLVANEYSPQN